jgi:hypothetical protein
LDGEMIRGNDYRTMVCTCIGLWARDNLGSHPDIDKWLMLIKKGKRKLYQMFLDDCPKEIEEARYSELIRAIKKRPDKKHTLNSPLEQAKLEFQRCAYGDPNHHKDFLPAKYCLAFRWIRAQFPQIATAIVDGKGDDHVEWHYKLIKYEHDIMLNTVHALKDVAKVLTCHDAIYYKASQREEVVPLLVKANEGDGLRLEKVWEDR